MSAAALHPTHVPGRVLLHPVSVTALAVWLVNDHVFKALWPGHLIVGKLSDVASLIAFPLLALAAYEWLGFLLRRRWDGWPVLVVGCAATAFVMGTINVFPAAADFYETGLGAAQWPFQAVAAVANGHGLPNLRPVQLWMDATDLLTLPCVAVPLYLGWRARRALGGDGPHRYAPIP